MPASNLFPNSYYTHGLFFDSSRHSPERVQKAIDFKLRDGDILVCGYPKCGTTWATYVIWSFENDGNPNLPSFGDMKGKIIPFMEVAGTDAVEKMEFPRKLNVHLPYSLTPKSSTAKYIYLNRNPGDCLVSYFHMLKQFYDWDNVENLFERFFTQFLDGEVVYGDYFSHVLSWYEHKDDENVLIIFYEDMLRNSREAVLKLAKFISTPECNYEIKLLANNGELLERIVKNTSFDSMKNVSMSSGALQNVTKLNQLKFFRKGMEKDWINYLNPDQIQRLKDKINERVDVPFLKTMWGFDDLV